MYSLDQTGICVAHSRLGYMTGFQAPGNAKKQHSMKMTILDGTSCIPMLIVGVFWSN